MSLVCQKMNATTSRPRLARSAGPSRNVAVVTAALAEGSRVKVTGPVKVFHAAKHPNGLELQGLEGTVKMDVTQFKGKVLSAVMPYRVEFMVDKDGSQVKVLAHLVSAPQFLSIHTHCRELVPSDDVLHCSCAHRKLLTHFNVWSFATAVKQRLGMPGTPSCNHSCKQHTLGTAAIAG